MMQSKDFVSSFSFKLKTKTIKKVSSIGQSNTFRLSIKKYHFFSQKRPKISVKSRLDSYKQKPEIKAKMA